MPQPAAEARIEGTVAAPPTRFRWTLMVLVFAIYTLASADRANVGIVLPFVKAEFGMTNTEAGAVISLFFVGYAVAQIPSGFLVRRLGVRGVFPVFMLLTSLFTGLLGTAGSALAMKANRLALGLAEAPLPVAILSTINRWFPPEEKGTAVGIFLAAAKFGPVLVPPLGAVVITAFGWPWVFYVCALPGIAFAVLWYALVSDDPARNRFVSAEEAAHIRADRRPTAAAPTGESGPGPRWLGRLDRVVRARRVRPIATARETFASRDIWGLALGYLLMSGIITVILSWLPTYLVTVKHLSILNVGFVSAAPFLGGVAGNLAGGWFSDRVVAKRRKPAILVSAVSTVCTMAALVHAPNEPATLAALLLLTGFLLNFGYSAFTVYPAGLTTADAYPLAVSVVNTGGQAGAALLPFATGVILDRYDWDSVFLFLGAASLVALGVMLLIVDPIVGEDGPGRA